MQIIGQRYNDKGVLSMGSAFEEIQPWAHIYDERVEIPQALRKALGISSWTPSRRAHRHPHAGSFGFQ